MPYFPHILSSDCYDEKCAIHNLRDSCIVNPSIIYLIVCFIFLLRHLHWRQDFLNEARLQAHRICIFERPVFLLLLDLFGSLLVGPARASSLLPLFVVQFVFFPFVKWFVLVLINSMVVASPAVFRVQKKILLQNALV